MSKYNNDDLKLRKFICSQMEIVDDPTTDTDTLLKVFSHFSIARLSKPKTIQTTSTISERRHITQPSNSLEQKNIVNLESDQKTKNNEVKLDTIETDQHEDSEQNDSKDDTNTDDEVMDEEERNIPIDIRNIIIPGKEKHMELLMLYVNELMGLCDREPIANITDFKGITKQQLLSSENSVLIKKYSPQFIELFTERTMKYSKRKTLKNYNILFLRWAISHCSAYQLTFKTKYRIDTLPDGIKSRVYIREYYVIKR